jgi:hypothetical protein
MVTFRTDGAWGAGKGSNLTAAEVDQNFHGLAVAIQDLVDNPVQGVSVVGFTVTGRTFKVNLSDGSEFGPYTMPFEGWRWAGALVAGDSYQAQDVFSVAGFGVYLVVQPYTAPEVATDGTWTFDPAESNTEGPLLQQLLGLMPSSLLTVVNTAADFVVGSSHLGAYVRVQTGGSITLPGDDLEAFPVGGTATFRAVSADPIAFVGASTEVVINTPETLTLRKLGSVVTAIRVDATEWDIAGDLELA